MIVSRRTMLKRSSQALGLALTPLAARAAAMAQVPVELTIIDSRFRLAKAFGNDAGPSVIDVAAEYRTQWRALRAATPQGRIAGLTRWTELVIVRGQFEEQGKRLKFEEQVPGSSLIRWEMG